jgi:hypothetical protein
VKQGIVKQGKQIIGRFLRKAGLPAVALGATLALAAPATVLARGPEGNHGGGRSFSQGRSFSGGGRNFGGGQRYSAPAPAYRGGEHYNGGGNYYGGGGNYYRGGSNYYRGGDHDRDRHYYRGYGPGYYAAPAYGFGFSYAPDPCNPGGYYDAYGQWIPYPGCYVAPYAPPY